MGEVGGDGAVAHMDHSADEVKPGFRFGANSDLLEVQKEIGSGAASRVYMCKRLKTGESFALKVINLQRLQLAADFESQLRKLNREVEILQALRHERIVNLIKVFRSDTACFLLIELVQGGELFYQIVQRRNLSELEARHVFAQLIEGLSYMHSKHVIHRDLKPENILIAGIEEVQLGPGPPGEHGRHPVQQRVAFRAEAPPPYTGLLYSVKIADFGLSKVITSEVSMATTFVGTPQYWAPEVLNVQRFGGSYGPSADYWSLGAVLYVMLCGKYPFDGKKMPLEEQILAAAFNTSSAAWQRLSSEARDLVQGLLQVDTSKRLSYEQCRAHPWVQGHFPGASPFTSSIGAASPQVRKPAGKANPRDPQPGHHEEGDRQPPPTQGNSSSSGASTQAPAHAYNDASRGPLPNITNSIEDEEQETIFCLSELLKLQLSIASSLEISCLGVRHADNELAEAIQSTLQQAREISQHTALVIAKYAQVAHQVSELVLEDLKLAVEEKEPELAVTLLNMVKQWVAGMKQDGEAMQHRYAALQECVRQLIQSAQQTKQRGDNRLFEAVKAAASDEAASNAVTALTDAPEQLALGGEGEERKESQASSTSGKLPKASSSATSFSPDSRTGSSHRPPSATKPIGLTPGTTLLFDQLTKLINGGLKPTMGAELPMMIEGAIAGGGHPGSKGLASGADSVNQAAEAMEKDVLDLLFMAPGVGASTLPTLETTDLSSLTRHDSRGSGSAGSGSVESVDRAKDLNQIYKPEGRDHVVYLSGSGDGLSGGGGGSEDSFSQDADKAAQSSANLLRALRELKRVDEILQGCSTFWANMDGTVQKLTQLKEHTECLVGFASKSKALKARFEERLSTYSSFWTSLERLCRQYCKDHESASRRMYSFLKQVNDASDARDTAESAKAGLMVGSTATKKTAQPTRRTETHVSYTVDCVESDDGEHDDDG